MIPWSKQRGHFLPDSRADGPPWSRQERIGALIAFLEACQLYGIRRVEGNGIIQWAAIVLGEDERWLLERCGNRVDKLQDTCYQLLGDKKE
jgi:hypothetical protein